MRYPSYLISCSHSSPSGGAFTSVASCGSYFIPSIVEAAWLSQGSPSGGPQYIQPMSEPEVWLRGPVPGYDPMVLPVVHSLLQVREDLARLETMVAPENVWARPGGAASIGFHVRHTGGALDRLLTYARGETLDGAQRDFLAQEEAPGAP